MTEAKVIWLIRYESYRLSHTIWDSFQPSSNFNHSIACYRTNLLKNGRKLRNVPHGKIGRSKIEFLFSRIFSIFFCEILSFFQFSHWPTEENSCFSARFPSCQFHVSPRIMSFWQLGRFLTRACRARVREATKLG